MSTINVIITEHEHNYESMLILMKRDGFDYEQTTLIEADGGREYDNREENLLNLILHELKANARKAIYGCRNPRRAKNKAKLKSVTGRVTIKLEESDDVYVLSCTDNGCGIPEEDKKKVFDDGFSRRGTTGIGLGMIKERARQLGGRVYFESQEGIGTTFYLELPKASFDICQNLTVNIENQADQIVSRRDQNQQMKLEEKWLNEYESQKGIPSSHKTKPSSVCIQFIEFLQKQGLNSGKLLDLGCGKGRNSFYFARRGYEVTGIDFVPKIVHEANKYSLSKGINSNFICQSLCEKLPFPNNYFDLSIDIYSYRFLTSHYERTQYRKELGRVLKKKSFHFLSLAAKDDGFYAPLLKQSQTNIVTDHFTQIRSIMLSKKDVEQEFSKQFSITTFFNKNQSGYMHGKLLPRNSLNFIMQKR
jgi:ubiquinone/menaquinone biosynthesis C-methylase UbiE